MSSSRTADRPGPVAGIDGNPPAEPDYGAIPLSTGAARRLFYLVTGLVLLSSAVGLLAAALGRPGDYQGWAFRTSPELQGLFVALIAAVILRRYPRHLFGWLALMLAVVSSGRGVLFEYAIYALSDRTGALPGGLFVAWFLAWNWYVQLTLLTLQMMVFPDGRLPSPRWRTVVWALLVLTVLVSALIAFTPGPMESSFVTLENPYGMPVLGSSVRSMPTAILLFPFISMLGSGAMALAVRWRRSRGVERQQLKWFFFVGFVVLATSPLAPSPDPALQAVFAMVLLLLPVAIAMAILRYRLWDIDLIIRRTLVYGLLSGLLALVYFGSVTALQLAFTALSGQQSPLALVISTLAIAALFSPLRRRVQAFIDRRFFRRKYDADRALGQFAATAQSEVELERLTGELLRLVRESVQPDVVSLWLRPRRRMDQRDSRAA